MFIRFCWIFPLTFKDFHSFKVIVKAVFYLTMALEIPCHGLKFQDKGPPNTLYYIVRDVVKIRDGYRYRLPHIGLAIEKLMGSAYKSSYTTDPFRSKYRIYTDKLKVCHDCHRLSE